MLGSLYQLRVPKKDKIERLTSVLGLRINAENERNKLVHSFWAHDQESNQAIRVKSSISYDDGYKIAMESFDYSKVVDLCRRLDAITADLARLLEDYRQDASGATTA
jgi:hypothetical protein